VQTAFDSGYEPIAEIFAFGGQGSVNEIIRIRQTGIVKTWISSSILFPEHYFHPIDLKEWYVYSDVQACVKIRVCNLMINRCVKNSESADNNKDETAYTRIDCSKEIKA